MARFKMLCVWGFLPFSWKLRRALQKKGVKNVLCTLGLGLARTTPPSRGNSVKRLLERLPHIERN